jgi:hypothetical protein
VKPAAYKRGRGKAFILVIKKLASRNQNIRFLNLEHPEFEI